MKLQKFESLSKVQGRESLIFQNIISKKIICSPFFIHFSCCFGKRMRFLLPSAYAFLTPSVHVPLDTVFNQIWWNNVIGWVKVCQKEVFSKRSRIKWNTRQDWSRFLDVSDANIWFWVEVNAFQTGKSSLQVSAVLQLCPFNHEEGLFFPCKSLHVFINQLSLLSSVLCVYCETFLIWRYSIWKHYLIEVKHDWQSRIKSFMHTDENETWLHYIISVPTITRQNRT